MYPSRMRTSNSSFQEFFGLYHSTCPSEEQHHRFWRTLNPAEIPYLPGTRLISALPGFYRGIFLLGELLRGSAHGGSTQAVDYWDGHQEHRWWLCCEADEPGWETCLPLPPVAFLVLRLFFLYLRAKICP